MQPSIFLARLLPHCRR